MKKFSFLALSLLATAFVGCKEDNPVIDEPVVVTPEVTLEAGETTETTIAFTVTSKDAEAVAYLVFEGETVPAAEDIFANGTAVEVNKAVEVTVEELNAETTYGVIAAARNGEQVKVADAIELTTLKGDEPDDPDNPDDPDGPKEEIKIARVEGGLNSFKEYRLWLHLNNGGLVYLTVNCADSEHNIIPANEYPVVFMGDPEVEVETDYEYYVHGDGSSYQLGYDMYAIREGKLVVTHLETEGYGLDLDVILDDEEKTALKLSFEGVIPASEIGGDFRNPPYVEPEKETVEVTITDLGAAYGNPGEMWYFWIDTDDDDAYSAFLMLEFPMVTDGVLPAATYTWAKDYKSYRDEEDKVKAGEYHIMCASAMDSHLVVKADESYVALVEGSTLKVEHDTANKAYILTLNLVGENGDTVTSTYTATAMRKQWDWAGANEFKFPGEGGEEPGPGPEPGESNCTIKGACFSDSFELWVYEPEQTDEILYISAKHTGTVMGVIPEGEYPFYTESKENMLYVRADWSASYNPDWATLAAGGKLVVAHTDNGYDISVECTDTNGKAYSYNYVGTMEANNEWSSVGNPPIPYDESTYNVTFDTFTGEYNGSNGFSFRGVTAEGLQFDFSLLAEGLGYDGIIPEGEYTIGGTDFAANYVNILDTAAESPMTISFVEGKITVAHLAEGYSITFNAKNVLKTTYVATFEGLVQRGENASYPFENPGAEVPAVLEATFTNATYEGEVDGGNGDVTRNWTLTNEDGSSFTLQLDPVFTQNGIVEGTYPVTAMYPWSYEQGQQFAGQNMPLTIAGSGQSYPFYISSGAVKIAKDGDNYTVTWAGYIYFYNIGDFENGNQKVKVSYTGALPME